MRRNSSGSNITKKRRLLLLTHHSLCLSAFVQGYCMTSHSLYHPASNSKSSPLFSSRFDIFENKSENTQFIIKTPQMIEERNNHPHKVVKDIQSCWQDLDKALHILYRAYPHLINVAPTVSSSSSILIIDGRSISATMDILKKKENWVTAYNLLKNTVQAYNWNKINDIYSSSQAHSDECSLRTVYKSFLSLAAHFKRVDWILYLLTAHLPLYAGLVPTVDMMHAMLSAFGRCDRLDLVLEWLTKMENEDVIHTGIYNELPKELIEHEYTPMLHLSKSPQSSYVAPAPDRLVYQTASCAFGSVRRGSEAAMILRRMQSRGFIPTLQSYNQILFAFSRAGNESDRHLEAIKILQEMENDHHIIPDINSYEAVISICMRENAWEAAAEIIRRCEGSSCSDKYSHMSATFGADESKMKKYIIGMGQFLKIGTGRYGWYKFGTYQNQERSLSISFGFQMHRNPGFNGLSFVFFNEENMEKLGFILVRHTAVPKEGVATSLLFSDLMGMYIDDKIRGKGLANIFMALWLKIAVNADFLPRTEIINKPLLSLVLSRFGFVPRQGGFQVIVSPTQRSNEDDTSPIFTLYSPTLKHMPSVFGARERRIQRMAISRTPPEHGGKETFVKTYFDHPWTVYSIDQGDMNDLTKVSKKVEAKELLKETINLAIPGCIDILYTPTELRFALFGFLIDT